MNKSDILYFYFNIIFDCSVVFIFFYLVIRKKKISDYFVSMNKRWVKGGKNQIYFEIVFRTCMLIIVIFLIKSLMPYFKDIQYMRNREFKTVTGIAKYGDDRRNDTIRKRYLQIIENGTNKKIHVIILDKYVKAGEILTVVYLPNSGFGSRVQKDRNRYETSRQNLAESVPGLNSKEDFLNWVAPILTSLLGVMILITIINVWVKSLRKQKNENFNKNNIVSMPVAFKKIGIFCLGTAIVINLFFGLGHASKMHFIMIGIPILLISLLWIYLMYRWKIIINSNNFIILQYFRSKRIVPFKSVEKMVLKTDYIIESEFSEKIAIYVHGKKIIDLAEYYEGYQYLKEALIKNNVKIEQE